MKKSDKSPIVLDGFMKNIPSKEPSSKTRNQGGAPVHLWNPDFCGDLDLTIEEDGSWIYNKTPIGRDRMVKLFASVLKREADKYFLVTPVEKMGLTVKDVPFIAISMEVEGRGRGKDQILSFTTNVGDFVQAGEACPLRFEKQKNQETIKPYIKIRHNGANKLEARLSRSVYYELANLCVTHNLDGKDYFGVWSEGHFFPMEMVQQCMT